MTDSSDIYPVNDDNYPDENWGHGGFAVTMGCHTLTSYPDIATGAQVIVSDDTGATIDIAHLSAGRYDRNGSCVFAFAGTVKAGSAPVLLGWAGPGTVRRVKAGDPQ